MLLAAVIFKWFLFCKAVWVASVYELCYTNKLPCFFLASQDDIFGGQTAKPPSFLLFIYLLNIIYSAIEVYSGPQNCTVKSCEIWHTGKGSCQEAMAWIWHRMAKGGSCSKQLKIQTWNRHISCPVWPGVMKLCSHIPLITRNRFFPKIKKLGTDNLETNIYSSILAKVWKKQQHQNAIMRR